MTTKAFFEATAKGRVGIGPNNFATLVNVTSVIEHDPLIKDESAHADARFTRALVKDRIPNTAGEMPKSIPQPQRVLAGTCLKILQHSIGLPPVGLIDIFKTVHPDESELIAELEGLREP